MGLLDLVSNTVTGVAEVTVNSAKLGVGVVAAPLDDGETLDQAVDGIRSETDKIGKSEAEDQ